MPTFRVLVTGLDAAGKSEFLRRPETRADSELVSTSPTIGLNLEEVEFRGEAFSIEYYSWDMGGSDKIGPLLRHYYRGNGLGLTEVEGTAAVVWVCDCMDLDRTEDMREELDKIMRCADDMGRPALLILANKQDLVRDPDHPVLPLSEYMTNYYRPMQGMRPADVAKHLGLMDTDATNSRQLLEYDGNSVTDWRQQVPWYVQGCAMGGQTEGLAAGLQWHYNEVGAPVDAQRYLTPMSKDDWSRDGHRRFPHGFCMKVVVLLLVGAQDHGDHGDHQEHSPLLFQSDHPLLEHVLAHLLSEDVALSDPDALGWKSDSPSVANAPAMKPNKCAIV